MSYVSKNPRFNSQILTDQGTSSVDDPASGSHKIVNRNGLLYMRDSSGNETAIGSAGATGGINYIDNPSAETGTDGWSTYADAAGTTPVDGTGGSANVTLTRTTTAGEILRGDASFELTVPANSQGEGFSYDFTIDKADQNKVLGIWFDVDATDSNYADDDLQVFIYDKDQSQLITPTSPTNGYKIKGNQYRHRVAFAPYDTSSNDYRLIVHVAADNASGYSVRFDNFEVGPGKLETGSIVTEWESFTPTSDMNTNTTLTGIKRRVGSEAEYRVNISISGNPSGSTVFDINIPDGTIDTSKLSSADVYESQVGYGAVTDATGGNAYPIRVVYYTNSKVRMYAYDPSGTYTDGQLVSPSVPILFTNNDDIDVTFTVPIAEWADSGIVITPSTEDLALSGWQSYTPTNTQGFGTITSRLQWRRNGTNVEIMGDFTAGTVAASEAQIELPNSYTIDFQSSVSHIGVGIYNRDLSSQINAGYIIANHGDTYINFGRDDRLSDENTLTPVNGNQLVGTSGRLSIFFSVPVAEFADLGQVPPIGVQLASATQYGLVKSASGSSIPILDSGTYTATASNLSNVSVSGLNGNWLRVGNIVTVSLACTTNTVTSSTASFEITLPVAATFSNAYELSGVFAYDQTSEGAVGIVEAQTTTAKITYAALNTGGYTSSIIFTYRIP